MCGTDLFLAILSILFPPIGVWVKRGICSADSLINLALCCLGFLPGLLHAWYIIWTYPEVYETIPADAEGATVTYYYVQQGPAPPPRDQQYQSHRGVPAAGYGTLSSSPNAQFPGQQSGKKNSFAQPHTHQSRPSGAGPSAAHPDGNENPPPTYAEVIKGDHKVQTQE